MRKVSVQYDPAFGQPAWQVATLFPPQGLWSEAEYLELTHHVRRFVEYTDGNVEVLPYPTTCHQRLLAETVDCFYEFIHKRSLGEILFGPLRVRLRPGMFREPDLVFQLTEHCSCVGNDFWEGADLVVEIVEETTRARDLKVKPVDYAKGGVAEYWIVDPRDEVITVHRLVRGKYKVHGKFNRGDRATSVLLAGFAVDVAAVFDAAQR